MRVLQEAIHKCSSKWGKDILWMWAALPSLWAFCVWLTVWWVALLHHSSLQVRRGSHAKLTAVEWMRWRRQNRLFLSWGVFWGDFAMVKERAAVSHPVSHPWRSVCTLLTKLKMKLLCDPGILLLISGQKKWNYCIRCKYRQGEPWFSTAQKGNSPAWQLIIHLKITRRRNSHAPHK